MFRFTQESIMVQRLYKIIFLVTFAILSCVIWELIQRGYEDYISVGNLLILSVGSIVWFITGNEIASWATPDELWKEHCELCSRDE